LTRFVEQRWFRLFGFDWIVTRTCGPYLLKWQVATHSQSLFLEQNVANMLYIEQPGAGEGISIPMPWIILSVRHKSLPTSRCRRLLQQHKTGYLHHGIAPKKVVNNLANFWEEQTEKWQSCRHQMHYSYRMIPEQ
jgi:hypothetical protein